MGRRPKIPGDGVGVAGPMFVARRRIARSREGVRIRRRRSYAAIGIGVCAERR